MSRLLSEDSLIHNLATYYLEGNKTLGECISETPTAYDVDKVIEQLTDMIESNVCCETGEPCDNWVVDMQNDIIEDCIKIVMKGGK